VQVYAGATDGVYVSRDSGQSWQPLGRESLEATVTDLTQNEDTPGVLYAGTEHHGIYRTTNGGADWEPWGLEGASVYAILVDASGTIWLGTDQGIFRR
jgi:ligand-binding sensor domain-containing protein